MIDFSNMLGKPLRHCFIPADKKAVTFVFQDGMRRSFGLTDPEARMDSLVQPEGAEGAIISALVPDRTAEFGSLVLVSNQGNFTLVYRDPRALGLVELPE